MLKTISVSDFLAAFFPTMNEPIHIRAFKPKEATTTQENFPLKIVKTRKYLQKPATLFDLEKKNRTRGIYFSVNSGGDNDKTIKRFNAWFAESDIVSIAEQHQALDSCPLQPSIRVETSKSVHAYWLIEGTCTEQDWREIQRRLIAYFGGDEKIKNPSRVMRLPGFQHLSLDNKGAIVTKLVECVLFEPSRRFTVEQMLSNFPALTTIEHKQSKSFAQNFTSWNDLNAELRRRMLNHPTVKIKGEWAQLKGICHDGKGDSALRLNVANNAYTCLSNCDTAMILRAFGLPEKPIKKSMSNNIQTQSVPLTSEPIDKPLLQLRKMSEIQPTQTDWLWFPYIPLGKLTMLEGDPGLGKSWITCALATAVAGGKGLPGMTNCTPQNVLMFFTEDGAADTVRPRLDSMNADVTKIYAVEQPVCFDERGLLAIEEAIINEKPALVIIDPLFAFIGASVDMHRANETRPVMQSLKAIAERHNVAFVLVRHLAKGGTNKAIYRGLGSIDFTAAVRSVLLVGEDPDDNAKRAIVQTKNNLAAFGSSIGYELRAEGFFWTGISSLTAERMLNAAAANDEEKSSVKEAEDFLRELLSAGAVESKEIERERRAAGISDYTLRKAKYALGIKSQKQGYARNTKWLYTLPEVAEKVAESVEEIPHQRLQ